MFKPWTEDENENVSFQICFITLLITESLARRIKSIHVDIQPIFLCKVLVSEFKITIFLYNHQRDNYSVFYVRILFIKP